MVKASIKKATIRTSYGVFPCVFELEKDMGGYMASSPKVQGAVSWGKNFAEAKRMVAEAIEGVYEANIITAAEKAGTVRFARSRIPAHVT